MMILAISGCVGSKWTFLCQFHRDSGHRHGSKPIPPSSLLSSCCFLACWFVWFGFLTNTPSCVRVCVWFQLFCKRHLWLLGATLHSWSVDCPPKERSNSWELHSVEIFIFINKKKLNCDQTATTLFDCLHTQLHGGLWLQLFCKKWVVKKCCYDFTWTSHSFL